MTTKKKRLINPYALFYVLDTKDAHPHHNAVNDYMAQWNDIVQNSTMSDALSDAYSPLPSGADVADSSGMASSDFGGMSCDGGFGGCDGGGGCSASTNNKRLIRAKSPRVSSDEAKELTQIHEAVQKIKYILHTIKNENNRKVSDGQGNHTANPQFVQHNYKVNQFALNYEKEMDKMLTDIKELLLDFKWKQNNVW